MYSFQSCIAIFIDMYEQEIEFDIWPLNHIDRVAGVLQSCWDGGHFRDSACVGQSITALFLTLCPFKPGSLGEVFWCVPWHKDSSEQFAKEENHIKEEETNLDFIWFGKWPEKLKTNTKKKLELWELMYF